MMKRSWILKGLMFLPLVALAVFVFGYGVMLLWNWLVPPLTGWHTLSFAQAIGLLVLCRILFGGHHGRRGGWHWRHRMRERFAHMTPEERERFRDTVGRRCRSRTPPTETAP
jgi:hypothetical protein